MGNFQLIYYYGMQIYFAYHAFLWVFANISKSTIVCFSSSLATVAYARAFLTLRQEWRQCELIIRA